MASIKYTATEDSFTIGSTTIRCDEILFPSLERKPRSLIHYKDCLNRSFSEEPDLSHEEYLAKSRVLFVEIVSEVINCIHHADSKSSYMKEAETYLRYFITYSNSIKDRYKKFAELDELYIVDDLEFSRYSIFQEYMGLTGAWARIRLEFESLSQEEKEALEEQIKIVKILAAMSRF